MALETATYISDLVSSNPTSSDGISQGDDHLRLLKSTLKATFPNVTGAVTPTHVELNYVDGVTSSIQSQLDTKAPLANPTFTGTVVLPSTTSVGNVSSTELGYLDGVTSALQTQIDGKAASVHTHLAADVTDLGALATLNAVGTSQIVDGAVTAEKLAAGAVPSSVPAASVMPYAGATEPSGWLFCFGQNVSRTTYAALFAVVGTTYGAGDGSTTFALPDLRGRVVAGQDDMGGTSANRLTNQSGGLDGDVLGATGGAETHTLTTAQMPAHTHNVTGNTFSSGTATVSISGTGTGFTEATSPAGGGGAHNNVQPTIILNYIIKT